MIGTVEQADESEGEPPGWCEPVAEADIRRRGFCGAFGDPREP